MTLESARARAALGRTLRAFFDSRSYLEVELPVASPYSIPEATIPLMRTSFHNPWKGDLDLFLLPSPEYHIKRLLAKGWGSMYSLSRAFRDAENIGRIHNPEFTMLEYYTVGADCDDSLALTQELLDALAAATTGFRGPETESTATATPSPVRTGGHLSVFAKPIRRLSMADAFREFAGSDLESWADPEDPDSPELARREALRLGVGFDENDDWNTIFQRIFLNRVEPLLPADSPVAVCDYPALIPSLAARKTGSPWVERWELYIGGVEIANAFSEERDPETVRAFFEAETQAIAESGLPVKSDPGFAEICAAMPKVSGVAVGWDRLVMALLGLERIQDAMLFSLHDYL